MKADGIDTVICFGLATDYCVAFSSNDAIKYGYKCFVVKDLCRAIDVNYEWKKMEDAGIKTVESPELMALLS